MIFKIAEIGINHNGDINIAKELIRMSHECGCDAVKFQKRDLDSVYTEEFLDSPRKSPWGNTQRDQKIGLELGSLSFDQIEEECRKLGIFWFASAWDLKSQEFINGYDVKFSKVASPMLTNLDLIDLIASKSRHTFISTGMSTKKEIQEAVNIFRIHHCSFELMHCVANYPLKPENANLNRIKSLRSAFRCNVGYSGHEVGIGVSLASCTFGITSLERHVTLDSLMYGSDQSSSLGRSDLKQLVKLTDKVESSLGKGSLSPNEEEIEMSHRLRISK